MQNFSQPEEDHLQTIEQHSHPKVPNSINQIAINKKSNNHIKHVNATYIQITEHMESVSDNGNQADTGSFSTTPEFKPLSNYDALEHQLIYLIQSAAELLPQTVERQKLLSELIRTVTTYLWPQHSPDMADALHHVLHYVSHNLDAVMAHTWQSGIYPSFIDGFKADCQAYHLSSPKQPIDFEDKHFEFSKWTEAIAVYIATDPLGEWSQTTLPSQPEITCQCVVLQRLQHHIDWVELANSLDISAHILAAFFQRECIPKLRKLSYLSIGLKSY